MKIYCRDYIPNDLSYAMYAIFVRNLVFSNFISVSYLEMVEGKAMIENK